MIGAGEARRQIHVDPFDSETSGLIPNHASCDVRVDRIRFEMRLVQAKGQACGKTASNCGRKKARGGGTRAGAERWPLIERHGRRSRYIGERGSEAIAVDELNMRACGSGISGHSAPPREYHVQSPSQVPNTNISALQQTPLETPVE